MEGQLMLSAFHGVHQHRLSIPSRRSGGHAVVAREYGFAKDEVAAAIGGVLASSAELCAIELTEEGNLVFGYAVSPGKERTIRITPIDGTEYHCAFLRDLQEDETTMTSSTPGKEMAMAEFAEDWEATL